MDLKPDDIEVGAIYRAKQPIKEHGTFRDLWNDRIVTWLDQKRETVAFNHASGSRTLSAQMPMPVFLKWVGRRLGPEEGSDVK